MRLDRLVTLGVVDPMRKATALGSQPAESGRVLPILMYHSIAEDLDPHATPYYGTVTTPKRFADQMGWLAEMGWQGATLKDGLEYLEGKQNPAHKPVAITFDDGFRDFHLAAFPVLQRSAFHATMYLPTGFIGEERCRFKSRECLTWTEVRELHRAGIEFGAHSVSHPVLYDLSWTEIERELAVSKAKIEEQLGVEVASFAYPYAFPQADGPFAKSFSELLEKGGFHNCVTTVVGRARPADDRYALRRLPVNECDDEPLLRAKLAGAYDWIAGPQKWSKAAGRQLNRVLHRTPVAR